ncbi:MAG TPA: CGNR zinc finger domain-containing protein [Solirubrobacterales bacterium]|nr:CGNR zinc finger domain-containing protein [Solirubrobacterales bacterium]
MSSSSEKLSLEPEVELLVAFVNTRDVETGSDALAGPERLREWVAETTGEHLPDLNDGDAARVRSLREALRALLHGNNGGEVTDEELQPLREAAERSRFRITASPAGQLELAPARSDLSGFEARVLLAIEHLQCHDAWRRLKACPDEECEWAFYDTTRNRSRTWCSMEVCGNRDKTRRYRQRKSGG